MDEKKIETTQKAIRKNAGEENAFVDLLNKETKELSDSFDSYLFYHGYRKESDTARECLEQFICRLVNARLVGVNDDLYYELLEAKDDLLKEKYGVDLGE